MSNAGLTILSCNRVCTEQGHMVFSSAVSIPTDTADDSTAVSGLGMQSSLFAEHDNHEGVEGSAEPVEHGLSHTQRFVYLVILSELAPCVAPRQELRRSALTGVTGGCFLTAASRTKRQAASRAARARLCVPLLRCPVHTPCHSHMPSTHRSCCRDVRRQFATTSA